MYRRPKFLEVLIEIRQEMARESDYDVDVFAETARRGNALKGAILHSVAVPPESAKPERKASKRKRA